VDTPKLDELERKIAEELTVYPRELYEADLEFMELTFSLRTKLIKRERFNLQQVLVYLAWSFISRCTIAFYSSSFGRGAVISHYQQCQQDKILPSVVKENAIEFRAKLAKLESKLDKLENQHDKN
jgi:BMFP domain-containing protein YqiC